MLRDLFRHEQLRPRLSWPWALLLVFLCGFHVLGIWLEVVYVKGVYEHFQLNKWGVSTLGTVVSRRVVIDDEGPDTYYITYDFRIDGEGYSREQIVHSETYRSHEKHGSINIQYLPSDPWISRIIGEIHPDILFYTIILLFVFIPYQIFSIYQVFSFPRKLSHFFKTEHVSSGQP